MPTYNDITTGETDPLAPLISSLFKRMVDNPIAMMQRDVDAPKIFGLPYDFQEFTAGGTWTKPAKAATGDKVIVHIVAGGASGDRALGQQPGGGGGGGVIHTYQDIDELDATETVVVGAGGAASASLGVDGGNSSFGTSGDLQFLLALGGADAVAPTGGIGGGIESKHDGLGAPQQPSGLKGGDGGDADASGHHSTFGGGGGGGSGSSGYQGGVSAYAGNGGEGSSNAGAISSFYLDGQFPGGGGGGVNTNITGDTVSGAGGDGVVRVWCFREET